MKSFLNHYLILNNGDDARTSVSKVSWAGEPAVVHVVDIGKIAVEVERADDRKFSQSPVPTLSVTITWAVIILGKKHRAKFLKCNNLMIADARLHSRNHRRMITMRK